MAEFAQRDGDWRASSVILSRLVNALEVEARLLGDLGPMSVSTTNVLIASPDYLKLRSGLVRCLAKFPAARSAVAALLVELESSPPEVEVDAISIEQAVPRESLPPSDGSSRPGDDNPSESESHRDDGQEVVMASTDRGAATSLSE
jgi:hypothetical protein